MAALGEILMQREPWSAMIMGNYALARAMIETGTRVITTFPGSPTPEIAAALTAVPEAARPYRFEFSTNEKVALEIAAGASLNGHLSAVFFKSVGLNVAADSLIQLSLMELIGGMVVVLGDDPGANSSQNEQDNRHFARMSYIPMLEPATPRETYEMYREATHLAVEHCTPVFFRLTTHVCHAREVVEFAALPADAPDWTPRFDVARGPYVPISETVFPLKRRALEKLALFTTLSEGSALNPVLAPCGAGAIEGKRLGVISAGLPALAALENLVAADQPVDLLKLGFSYPLPVAKILEFLRAHDEVLVLEELDRVMETEIKALAFEAGVRCRVHARPGLEELMGELGPERTWSLLSATWPDVFAPRQGGGSQGGTEGAEGEAAQGAHVEAVVPRLPQMCPGCGHRSAFHAVKAALAELDEPITVADIGCHSLGFLPPYEMGEVLFSMGHSVSTGAGLSLGNDERKVIAFLGDATLFHAGLPGIVNSIVYDHDVTLVVLDNATTAMTGHQARFGSGEVGPKIELGPLFETLGVRFLREVDAYQQDKLVELLKEAMTHKGFAVVIAKHPCMLKFTRERLKKKPDFKMPQVAVDPVKCDRLHTCVRDFGCPSFVRHDDGSVTVHSDLCIGDGSCLQVCPVSALEQPRPGEGVRGKPGGGK